MPWTFNRLLHIEFWGLSKFIDKHLIDLSPYIFKRWSPYTFISQSVEYFSCCCLFITMCTHNADGFMFASCILWLSRSVKLSNLSMLWLITLVLKDTIPDKSMLHVQEKFVSKVSHQQKQPSPFDFCTLHAFSSWKFNATSFQHKRQLYRGQCQSPNKSHLLWHVVDILIMLSMGYLG